MIECGAYWSFYSMWFCKEIDGGTACLLESESENLEFSRKNFELNGFKGRFFQKLVGSENGPGAEGREMITLDAFVQEHGLKHIDILHADIQGAEREMLDGANSLLANQRISFFFISTHSEELHRECERFLLQASYEPFVSIPPRESFSVDGILVARSEAFQSMRFEQPSRRGRAAMAPA